MLVELFCGAEFSSAKLAATFLDLLTSFNCWFCMFLVEVKADGAFLRELPRASIADELPDVIIVGEVVGD